MFMFRSASVMVNDPLIITTTRLELETFMVRCSGRCAPSIQKNHRNTVCRKLTPIGWHKGALPGGAGASKGSVVGECVHR
ncbi:hypothetical protein DV096_12500 [Bradymonadaceae bacterium TMQ3]|nr:hypothetical protein DV096_12500 [Bradymonadaceae bacterium TMQ3]